MRTLSTYFKKQPVLLLLIAIIVLLLIGLGYWTFWANTGADVSADHLNSSQTALLEEVDHLDVFYSEKGGFQFGDTLRATVTDQDEIATLFAFFESGTVTNDSAVIEEPSTPYYYQFFAGEEVVAEYIFQNDKYDCRFIDGELRSVAYANDLPNFQLNREDFQ